MVNKIKPKIKAAQKVAEFRQQTDSKIFMHRNSFRIASRMATKTLSLSNILSDGKQFLPFLITFSLCKRLLFSSWEVQHNAMAPKIDDARWGIRMYSKFKKRLLNESDAARSARWLYRCWAMRRTWGRSSGGETVSRFFREWFSSCARVQTKMMVWISNSFK